MKNFRMTSSGNADEELHTSRGNPLLRHQRDNMPLARVAAFQFMGDQEVQETAWPRVWMRRVKEKFELRRSEASRNLVLNGLMLKLLKAAEKVCDIDVIVK